ncbi:MAG TPA: dTMP kinase [Fimbriimonadales bacterium]|nr:dTMP kinase [Fimbriimonadales bacterium]
MKGKLITLEGTEGSGKSTLASALAKRFEETKIPVLLTREPGDGTVGKLLRELILHSGDLDAWTEAFLFLADRRQHCKDIIHPALEKGTYVVCDRFADSTIAYQGYGRGLPIHELKHLNEISTDSLVPDITFLLDIEPEFGLKRVDGPDRMDSEPLEFHRRVREGFLKEAASDPKRWRILDGRLSKEELLEKAWVIVSEFVSNPGYNARSRRGF